jgi:aminoglycoside/choline kinase family phosphotransferase
VTQSFEAIWKKLIAVSKPVQPVWMLRDFHSVNLIWMPERKGLQRVGIIDTQDAVMGHAAYDAVSLIQDARHDVAVELQEELYGRYLALRAATGGFDAASFARDYAISGAQRASRLLGTFTRLGERDGKHQYLRHRPRVARYLMQNLRHPALAELADWYRAYLPEALELAKT